MRLELLDPCKHGYTQSHGTPEASECPGGSRSTVSGFSPEAIQAAAAIYNEWWLDTTDPHDPTQEPLAEMVRRALAAAWAHDFEDMT